MTAGAPYEVGDFPTRCPACGLSYWGSYHDCPGWRTYPLPPVVTTNTTVDSTAMLAAAVNRLAAALEALNARYDTEPEKKERDGTR